MKVSITKTVFPFLKFSLNMGPKILLKETDLIISRGINYGLIAPNDDKTSLLNFIAEKLKIRWR